MKQAKRFLLLTFGCLLFSAGISLFLDPNHIAPGGTTGLAIILHTLTGNRTGTIILIMNIPILIFGWVRFGTRFILQTIYVTVMSSSMMNAMAYAVEQYGTITSNCLLAGAVGGTLESFGLGIIFLNGATAGGSDIIIKALRQKFIHIKTGTMYLVSDVFIIGLSAICLRNIEIALYALITVIIGNFVLDKVLYSQDHAKLLYIISERADVIVERFINEVDIGVTYLEGKGAYSLQRKNIIMCVVQKSDYGRIRDIIKQEDTDAFLIVSGASEVFGYGYKDFYMEEI